MRNAASGHSGQTLILFLVLIPTLLLVAGLIIRSGKTLLIHNRLQSHCDRKVLNTLMWQARGLQQLGLINPYAKLIINSRRTVDKALKAAIVAPYLIPALEEARLELLAAQRLIRLGQQGTVRYFISMAAQEARSATPTEFAGKITEHVSPATPFLPHFASESLTLHTREIPNYRGETGAPLELDADFTSRQKATEKITMKTESFLERWPHLKRLNDVRLICEAYIKMEKLEGSWQVELRPITDRL